MIQKRIETSRNFDGLCVKIYTRVTYIVQMLVITRWTNTWTTIFPAVKEKPKDKKTVLFSWSQSTVYNITAGKHIL